MLWNLHSSGVELGVDLQDHLERRLLFALSRFAPKVLRIDVHVADENGPKGGIDKSCEIIVKLRGQTNVIARSVDSDWPVCIDRATTRIGQNVGRTLERRRERESRPV